MSVYRALMYSLAFVAAAVMCFAGGAYTMHHAVSVQMAANASVGSSLVEEVKRQIQNDMGLLPVRVLRDRSRSFVELNAWDSYGNVTYGTAGHLGSGHFITVKHGVVALEQPVGGREPRRITRIALRYGGLERLATVVDAGDARVEVDPGDWAIVRVDGDVALPALHLDTAYPYAFADPIFASATIIRGASS